MGSDWTWSLSLPRTILTEAVVEDLVAEADAAGFTLPRPDGAFTGLDTRENPGEHRLLERAELITGLAQGNCATQLWTASEVDIFLRIDPGDATEPASVRLILDAAHTWRTPEAGADPYRRLHGRLTELWLEIAAAHGADYGRVEDEWSDEQIRNLVPLLRTPLPLGWWTYLDAAHAARLPPLPSGVDGIEVTTSPAPGGATVIALSDDPAGIDPVAFENFHLRLLGL